MQAIQVTERKRGRHRLFLTESQKENRAGLLEYLEMDEIDMEPPDRSDRRAITAYLSVDEVTQFTYMAEACGFRGSGGLALALMRHFMSDFPMPKVRPPKRTRR